MAHDLGVSSEMFAAGKELVIYYAQGQEGLRKTPGALWIYSGSYIVALCSVTLLGLRSEEIFLGRDD